VCNSGEESGLPVLADMSWLKVDWERLRGGKEIEVGKKHGTPNPLNPDRNGHFQLIYRIRHIFIKLVIADFILKVYLVGELQGNKRKKFPLGHRSVAGSCEAEEKLFKGREVTRKTWGGTRRVVILT